MNIAMIFAMLLASGTCARTEFQGPGGVSLNVIVCPVMGSGPAEVEVEEPGDPA